MINNVEHFWFQNINHEINGDYRFWIRNATTGLVILKGETSQINPNDCDKLALYEFFSSQPF